MEDMAVDHKPILSPPQLFEFRVAAVVARFLDQGLRLGEIAASQVIVGQVEAHTGAGSDAEDFNEILGRTTGEERERKLVKEPPVAEELDCLLQMISGIARAGGVGAAQ